MRPRLTVSDWKRAVLRSSSIPDSTRVLLLHLADRMSAERKVSVPRAQLAEDLGRAERRIAERVSDAIRAGFLVVVSKGYRGHTAVYQGTLPGAQRVTESSTQSPAERVTKTSTQKGADLSTLSPQESVTPGGHTSTRSSPYEVLAAPTLNQPQMDDSRSQESEGAAFSSCATGATPAVDTYPPGSSIKGGSAMNERAGGVDA